MQADILRPGGAPVDETGHWDYVQDEDSGSIVRVWVTDDPDTPAMEGLTGIPCLVRGVIDGGIRVAGTTERFSEIYESVDWAKMTFPANITITKRDKVTNVRGGGKIIWTEEEAEGNKPTVFNVMGVTPVLDPFGRHVENVALLQRAEVQ